jgi:hypothetical protein
MRQAEAASSTAAGTQQKCTCFTGTKVQILVQKYKY